MRHLISKLIRGFICFTCTIAFHSISAQSLALEGSLLIPGGDFGSVYQTGPGLRLSYYPDEFEDDPGLVSHFSLGIHFMQTKMDTFPLAAYVNGQLVPGSWETYNDMTFWELSGTMKQYFGFGPVKPFVGAAITIAAYDYIRENHVPGIGGLNESGGLLIGTLTPIGGLQYEFAYYWFVYAAGRYSIGLSEEGWYRWGNTALGVRYAFW